VSEQPEALRLADWLDTDACDLQTPRLAAAELRRQHEVIAEMLAVLKEIMSWEENEQALWAKKARAAISKAEGVKP
jgi:hypothetical protein